MICNCSDNGIFEWADGWGDQGTVDSGDGGGSGAGGEGDGDGNDGLTGGGGGGGTTGVDDGSGVSDSSGVSDQGFDGTYDDTIDFNILGSAFGRLGSKFPFNLRHTVTSLANNLVSSGGPPLFSYQISGHTVNFDLKRFDEIATVIRSFFALGCALGTIYMIINLFVGIKMW